MTNLMIRSATGRYRQAQKAEVLEVAAQYLAVELQTQTGQPMTSPSAVRQFLLQALAARDAEVFCILFFDNRHRLIQFEEMFRGTIDGASVYPREVVRRTIELNAAAVVLVHNHPSGLAEPSQADEMITHRLRDALALIDVRVLDHLVVGRGQVVSFAERGLI
jgi:DNA repair protein RadC